MLQILCLKTTIGTALLRKHACVKSLICLKKEERYHQMVIHFYCLNGIIQLHVFNVSIPILGVNNLSLSL